jgi:hypothetical protein
MFIVSCRATHSFDLYRVSCGRNMPITTGKPDLVKEKMCARHCVNWTPRDKKKGSRTKAVSTYNRDTVNFQVVLWKVSIPVAARSKAWVYGRWLSGTVGMNPTWDMDTFLL